MIKYNLRLGGLLMKNRNLLFAMICGTFVCFACSDELEKEGGKPIIEGDEILFGASNLATFEDGYSEEPNSRTEYGESYYDGKKWHFPLNWVYGDGISVYCPEAGGNVKYTHYTIEWDGGKPGEVSDEQSVYMMKVGDNGLHWGDTSKEHRFYAFYPSSAILNDEAFAGGIVHGSIPNTQEMEWVETPEGNWVGKPNMEYAYMRAYNIITPADAANDKVTLEFKPLTTAVEITLTASDNLTGGTATISQLNVLAANKDGSLKQTVCGDFTYNIDDGTTTLENPDVANDYMITVPCWHEKDGKQVPIELNKGQSLTFTVFLLPRSDDGNPDRSLHNLQIRVPGWNSTARVKTYENVTIPVGTKSKILLPDYEPLDGANNWIGGLPENVYISQLSIPGSVNAFSWLANDNYGDGDEIDQTQTKSLEEQFKIGVRAFEIAVERGVFSSSLSDVSLVAGDKHLSKDFKTAMEELADQVAENPSEFVLVMPYYSPTSLGGGEDIPDWIDDMRTYINKDLPKKDGKPAVKSKDGTLIPILPFSNTMTIGDAKGSILLLTRVATDKNTNPQHTTVIHDWNADKDRWDRRGWKRFDGANPYEPNVLGNNNWIYTSEAPASVGTPTYHVQDWMRVCKQDGSYKYGFLGLGSQQWYESKNEKLSDIKDFMDECILTLKDKKDAQDVFINNLAGYYIVSKSGGSSADYNSDSGGKHGDIPSFAYDVNNVIYNYILDLNYSNRGPLGIVLINYSGESYAFGKDMHGDYIVKALVDNNFRFELVGAKK